MAKVVDDMTNVANDVLSHEPTNTHKKEERADHVYE